MSTIPREMIGVMAEWAGHGVVADEVAGLLAADLDYRIRDIVQVVS